MTLTSEGSAGRNEFFREPAPIANGWTATSGTSIISVMRTPRNPRKIPRSGAVVIILLGLLSVMLFLAFTLFQRQRGHGNLVAFGDAHLYARYFLEAYLGDVVSQLKQEANDESKKGKGNVLYDFFRSSNRSFPKFYKPSAMLKSLPERWAADLNVEVTPDWSPTVGFATISPMIYPASVVPPEKYGDIEKRGAVYLRCSATVQGRYYALSAKIPISVVMRLSPLLREFILFCDQIHLEQVKPFGREDMLNIVFTKDGVHPKEPEPEFRNYKGQPWVLWPSVNHLLDPHRTGRVFLGADDEPIYLNLAGERTFRQSYVSELWQVWPTWFKANKVGTMFANNPIFMDRDMKFIHLRGMDIPLKNKGFLAKMGVLGFSHELYDPDNGIFSNTVRTLESIWGSDPSFQRLTETKPSLSLALSSSLKLYGLNTEPDIPDSDSNVGFAREVFGKVFSRFFLLTFFEFPSAQGGGQILVYNSSPDHRPPPCPKFQGFDTVTFEPPDPAQKYTWFMSRVVSGGADRDVLSEANMPYNVYCPPGTFSKTILDASKFKPLDGLTMRGKFSDFAKDWLRFNPNMPLGAASGTLQSRVSQVFPDQKSFKEFARVKEGKFWVDGVVYIRGTEDDPGLTLDDITTTDIHGGIVIVEKDITLGNITRGLDFKGTVPIEKVVDTLEKLEQPQFLTFVSRKGCIRMRGDKQLGVQLVAIDPGNSVRDQISWLDPKKIVFGGGIAVDTPNMANRVKEFGKSGQDPIFLYAPKMADPDPSTMVQVYPKLDAYKFTMDTADDQNEYLH